MATSATERSVLGRIWECQSRIMRLTAQRNELVESISPAVMSGNIEKAYDLAEATTRLDAQLLKAEADLELWKSVQR